MFWKSLVVIRGVDIARLFDLQENVCRQKVRLINYKTISAAEYHTLDFLFSIVGSNYRYIVTMQRPVNDVDFGLLHGRGEGTASLITKTAV